MALRYRKRSKTGAHSYNTLSISSRGTNISSTIKSGRSTVTQSKYGTRYTYNFGNGTSDVTYKPSGIKQRRQQKAANPFVMILTFTLIAIVKAVMG